MTKKEFTKYVFEIQEAQAKAQKLTQDFFSKLDNEKLDKVVDTDNWLDTDTVISEFLVYGSDNAYGISDINTLWDIYQGKINPMNVGKGRNLYDEE